MLIDLDTLSEPQSVAMEEVVESLVEDFKEVTILKPKKCNKYGQNEHFNRVIQEDELTVLKVAEQYDIPRSSAYFLST
jgi:hypothetical protein